MTQSTLSLKREINNPNKVNYLLLTDFNGLGITEIKKNG